MTYTHIGVSHTSDLAAVVISRHKCAVDVERLDRDLNRARGRFISEQEEQLPDSVHKHFAVAMWCAKETLYKLAGRRELDLLRDIAITRCDLGGGTITGSVLGGASITMTAAVIEQWIVVYYQRLKMS